MSQVCWWQKLNSLAVKKERERKKYGEENGFKTSLRIFAVGKLVAVQSRIYCQASYSAADECFACLVVDFESSAKIIMSFKPFFFLPDFVFQAHFAVVARFVSSWLAVPLLFQQDQLELLLYPFFFPRPWEIRVWDKLSGHRQTRPLKNSCKNWLIFAPTKWDFVFFSEVVIFHRRCRGHSLLWIHDQQARVVKKGWKVGTLTFWAI